MKNLYADIYLGSVLDVTPGLLRAHGAEGLILDIDNTLIGHNVPIPDETVIAHLKKLSGDGIKLCVVSNNRESRVKPFCEKIGVGAFVCNALKPLRSGYERASLCMKLPLSRIAAVGDQVFTDVWGAKRAGCVAILTKPIHNGGEGFFIALKRLAEKPFLRGKF